MNNLPKVRLDLSVLQTVETVAENLVGRWREGRSPRNHVLLNQDSAHPMIVHEYISENCQSEDAITARYGAGKITASLPCQELKLAPSSVWTEITPFIVGILIQEVTHFRQDIADPNGFKLAVKRQKRWKESKSSDLHEIEPQEFLDQYYDTPFEFEAHAAQVAAEARLTNIDATETRTWCRMARRLGSVLDVDEDFGSRFRAEVDRHRFDWLACDYSDGG